MKMGMLVAIASMFYSADITRISESSPKALARVNSGMTEEQWITAAKSERIIFEDYPAVLCETSTCVVKHNGGGQVVSFVKTAVDIREKHQKLIIDGPCYSACTILADLVRDQTCITYKAMFAYHKTNLNGVPNLYSWFVHNYVESRGGWPEFGTGKFIRMPYYIAAKHWKTCSLRKDIHG